ncbi:hypothetical protein [Pedobacter lusitanus]
MTRQSGSFGLSQYSRQQYFISLLNTQVMAAKSKVLAVQKTIRPWNESQNDVEGWREYIHAQLEGKLLPTHMLIVEANRIITKKPSFRPTTRKEREQGDQVIYLIMFITAIALAVAISTTN